MESRLYAHYGWDPLWGGPDLAAIPGAMASPLMAPPYLGLSSTDEVEVLRLLAAGRTMAQIADLLNVSCKTIANNCTKLKQKLGARSTMDLMRIAIEAPD
jgi:DNA-binding NarL/FixJ family response regulator